MLANGLLQIPGLSLTPPATNMVFVTLQDSIRLSETEIAGKLKEYGIMVGVTGKRTFRMVLHYWIDDLGIRQTVDAFRKVIQDDLV